MGDRDEYASAPARPAMNEDAKLFVGNLSFDTEERDLEEAFGKFGTIADVRVIKDRETNRPRGFAFVTFTDARDADDAMKELQGTELQGRTVRIDRSTPKGGAGPPRGGSGGGYGAPPPRSGGYDAPRGGGYDAPRGGGGYDAPRGGGGYDAPRGGGGYDAPRGGGGYDAPRGGGYDAPRGGGGYDRDAGGRGSGGGAGGKGICYSYQKGDCKYGTGCRYSHDGPTGGGAPPRSSDRGASYGGDRGGDYDASRSSSSRGGADYPPSRY